MPGTPAIVTSCVDGSRRTRSNADSSRSRSRSRPTSAVAGPLTSTPTRALASATSHTGTGSALPFASHRLVIAVVDHVPSRAEGRFADEDSIRRRSALQARGGVHDVARDHPLSQLWTRIDVDERVPGVHGDADFELAVVGDPVADRQRRAHRPLGIVLVRDRRAEHRHHGVADELLHGAAAVLELRPQPFVVRDAGSPRRPRGRAIPRAR